MRKKRRLIKVFAIVVVFVGTSLLMPLLGVERAGSVAAESSCPGDIAPPFGQVGPDDLEVFIPRSCMN